MDGFGEMRVNRYKASNQSFRSDIQGGKRQVSGRGFGLISRRNRCGAPVRR